MNLETDDATLEGVSRHGGSEPSKRPDQRLECRNDEGSVTHTGIQQTGTSEVRGIRPTDAPEHRPGCGILRENSAAPVERFDLGLASSFLAAGYAYDFESACGEHSGDYPDLMAQAIIAGEILGPSVASRVTIRHEATPI